MTSMNYANEIDMILIQNEFSPEERNKIIKYILKQKKAQTGTKDAQYDTSSVAKADKGPKNPLTTWQIFQTEYHKYLKNSDHTERSEDVPDWYTRNQDLNALILASCSKDPTGNYKVKIQDIGASASTIFKTLTQDELRGYKRLHNQEVARYEAEVAEYAKTHPDFKKKDHKLSDEDGPMTGASETRSESEVNPNGVRENPSRPKVTNATREDQFKDKYLHYLIHIGVSEVKKPDWFERNQETHDVILDGKPFNEETNLFDSLTLEDLGEIYLEVYKSMTVKEFNDEFNVELDTPTRSKVVPSEATPKTSITCTYVFTKGATKGTVCGKMTTHGDKCTKHTK